MTNISLKDVYEITNRIEEKLDNMGTRVGDLEIWRAGIKSQVAIIAGVFSIVIGVPVILFTDWIKKRLNI
ncbi:MAG: hypothetical protein AAB922_06835 [Patescibacteria group bacterium]